MIEISCPNCKEKIGLEVFDKDALELFNNTIKLCMESVERMGELGFIKEGGMKNV